MALRLLRGRTTKGHFKVPYTVEQTKDMITAAMIAEVRYRGRNYRETPEIAESIRQAAEWMCKGEKFGLLLCGQCGNGKTTLMSALKALINHLQVRDAYGKPFEMWSVEALELVRMRTEKKEAFDKYKDAPMLAIDDVGLEPTEILSYGNVINPIVELLSHRYNKQLTTVITTNLKPSEIRQKYGDRLADRFNEMMVKIMFRGDSFRLL